MTPAAMTNERIAELRENIRTGRLIVKGNVADIADLLGILDDYEKQRPLIQEYPK